MPQIHLIALDSIPLISPFDDLGKILLQSINDKQIELESTDVIVVAQKIVSKSENRYLYLNTVEVTAEAQDLAEKTHKDPRVVQAILNESDEVLKHRPGAIIVAHKLGYVHANAGIDQSNISQEPDNPRVLLLPENPDVSAAQLRDALPQRPAVIISDSAGRAWRNGIIGFAIGSAGIEAVVDRVGQPDLYGKPLEITQIAMADELASAASILMGQGNESVPAVLIRGAPWLPSDKGSSDLIRPKSQDLFR